MSVPIWRRTREGWISGAPANASSHCSGLSVTHVRPMCRATAAGVGEHRGRRSEVDTCRILRSATSTRDIAYRTSAVQPFHFPGLMWVDDTIVLLSRVSCWISSVVCRRRCYQKAQTGMSTHGYR